MDAHIIGFEGRSSDKLEKSCPGCQKNLILLMSKVGSPPGTFHTFCEFSDSVFEI